eukprot:619178-Alexandrium_andersonii.AAC.1
MRLLQYPSSKCLWFGRSSSLKGKVSSCILSPVPGKSMKSYCAACCEICQHLSACLRVSGL